MWGGESVGGFVGGVVEGGWVDIYRHTPRLDEHILVNRYRGSMEVPKQVGHLSTYY